MTKTIVLSRSEARIVFLWRAAQAECARTGAELRIVDDTPESLARVEEIRRKERRSEARERREEEGRQLLAELRKDKNLLATLRARIAARQKR